MTSLDTSFLCTLVTPVRNERDNIARLWQTIVTQTRPPNEWIIMDNGSTDGTYEWLITHANDSPFPVKVLSLPKKKIAEMMNIAIKQATHNVVACCHGGTCIPQHWLEHILAPFHANLTIEAVGGIWQPYGEMSFEKWVATSMPITLPDSAASFWLPAARSLAFRKSVWENVGGFPEWLPMFGEDTLFGIRLHAMHHKFIVVKDAVIGWRPKSTLRTLFRQYRLYAEADAVMGFANVGLKFFSRPWGILFIVLLLGILLNSIWFGVLILFVLAGIDFLTFYFRGMYRSIGTYFLWIWFIRIAQQTGMITGTYLRYTGIVNVPESDMQAIQAYRALITSKVHS